MPVVGTGVAVGGGGVMVAVGVGGRGVEVAVGSRGTGVAVGGVEVAAPQAPMTIKFSIRPARAGNRLWLIVFSSS